MYQRPAERRILLHNDGPLDLATDNIVVEGPRGVHHSSFFPDIPGCSCFKGKLEINVSQHDPHLL
jgi:hypothetical protein